MNMRDLVIWAETIKRQVKAEVVLEYSSGGLYWTVTLSCTLGAGRRICVSSENRTITSLEDAIRRALARWDRGENDRPSSNDEGIIPAG